MCRGVQKASESRRIAQLLHGCARRCGFGLCGVRSRAVNRAGAGGTRLRLAALGDRHQPCGRSRRLLPDLGARLAAPVGFGARLPAAPNLMSDARLCHKLGRGPVLRWQSLLPAATDVSKRAKDDRRIAHVSTSESIPDDEKGIALSLIFECVGESRYNRTADEYDAIAAQLPPIKVLHGYVNDRLEQYAEAPPYRLCYFQAGDRRAWLDDFPDRSRSRPCESRW